MYWFDFYDIVHEKLFKYYLFSSYFVCVYVCVEKNWEVIKENINTIPESYKNRYYERFLGDTPKPPLNDSFPSFCQAHGFNKLGLFS